MVRVCRVDNSISDKAATCATKVSMDKGYPKHRMSATGQKHTKRFIHGPSQNKSTIFIYLFILFYFLWRCDPTWVMASSFLRFLDHTQQHTTVGRTPLDEWSAHRRDLYLTIHNNHNRQTPMPLVGFKPTISAGERPQTYTLDCTATGTGTIFTYKMVKLYHTKLEDLNPYNDGSRWRTK